MVLLAQAPSRVLAASNDTQAIRLICMAALLEVGKRGNRIPLAVYAPQDRLDWGIFLPLLHPTPRLARIAVPPRGERSHGIIFSIWTPPAALRPAYRPPKSSRPTTSAASSGAR